LTPFGWRALVDLLSHAPAVSLARDGL